MPSTLHVPHPSPILLLFAQSKNLNIIHCASVSLTPMPNL